MHDNPNGAGETEDPETGQDAHPTREPPHYLKAELDEYLKLEPRLFEFVHAGSLDGMWFWDLEKPEHEWLSPQFWKILGYAPETKEHLAREWQDIIYPEDLAVAVANAAVHFADPTRPYDQEVRYRHADGSTVWIRCRGIAIRDSAGRAIRMLGVHNDLTSLRIAQANLAQQERLVSIGTLAAGIAHQLNNPIGAILTTAEYATLLIDDAEAGDITDFSELRDTLSRCVLEARRCGNITKALLQLARGESGDRHPSVLRTIVSSVVQACGGHATERDASLRCAWAAEDADVMADVSPIEIEQALLNIVRNAVQSKLKGAVVVVELIVSNGIATICVSDDGRGILPQEQRQLFDPFFSTRINEGGSGLGLPIARRIIEQHGGWIVVDSQPEFGTSVSIKLPTTQASDVLPVG